MKRNYKQVKKAILKVLSDGKMHSYAEIEKKANTNWLSVRNHIEDLELFEAVKKVKDRIIITDFGIKVLSKIKNSQK